ncbi:MAG: hypothetical protein SFW67_17900 [Myxococcaceae bacterium]|nr:hypothetical protein [Myxococcaceae bacterium]
MSPLLALHALVGALCVELTPAQGPDADEVREALTVRAAEARLDLVFASRCEEPLLARVELGLSSWAVTLRRSGARSYGRTLDQTTGSRALWAEQVAFLTVSSAAALLAGRTPVTLTPMPEPEPVTQPETSLPTEPPRATVKTLPAPRPPGERPRPALVVSAMGLIDTFVSRRPALGGGVGLGAHVTWNGWLGEGRVAFDASANERLATPSASLQLSRWTLSAPLFLGLERGPFSIGGTLAPGVEHIVRQTTSVAEGFEATPTRGSWRFLVAASASGRWWPWANLGLGVDVGVRWRPGAQSFLVDE